MGAVPHGGRLTNRVLSGAQKEEAVRKAPGCPRLEVSQEQACQVENIATGVYSPLEGFLTQADLLSVLHQMRLTGGVAWTIPIILDVDRSVAGAYKEGQDVLLTFKGRTIGLLHLKEKYGYDKQELCRQVFGTGDSAHPGIKRVSAMGDILFGGEVDLIEQLNAPFACYHLTPRETRVLFSAKGWRTIVGFQTRNVPHLGHEYVQKTALTFVDGLFVNPVVGPKKRGDFKDEVILAAYDALLRNYYLKDRAVVAILRTGMYYAAPERPSSTPSFERTSAAHILSSAGIMPASATSTRRTPRRRSSTSSRTSELLPFSSRPFSTAVDVRPRLTRRHALMKSLIAWNSAGHGFEKRCWNRPANRPC